MEKYRPTREEIEKAEQSMTDEQRQASAIRQEGYMLGQQDEQDEAELRDLTLRKRPTLERIKELAQHFLDYRVKDEEREFYRVIKEVVAVANRDFDSVEEDIVDIYSAWTQNDFQELFRQLGLGTDFRALSKITKEVEPITEAMNDLEDNFYEMTNEEKEEYLNIIQKGEAILRTGLANKLTSLKILRTLRNLSELADSEGNPTEPHNNKYAGAARQIILRLSPIIETNVRHNSHAKEEEATLDAYHGVVLYGNANEKPLAIALLARNLDILQRRVEAETDEDYNVLYRDILRDVAEQGSSIEADLALETFGGLARKKYDSSTFPHYVLELLELKNQKGNKLGAKVVADYLKAMQLPVEEITAAWAVSNKEAEYPKVAFGNVISIQDLEQQKPGICKFLYDEFGIADFNRYPDELLLKQYEEFNDNSRPYGLIIYPRNDHNGAFGLSGAAFKNLLEDVKNEFSLRVAECESKFDIARTLIKFDKKYNVPNGHKISLLILGGHGTRNSIDFGGNDARHTLYIQDLTGRGVRRTGGYFEDNPTIILTSCSTGANAGIAQELSRTLGAKVIAPKIPTNIKSYNAKKLGKYKFEFSAEYNDANSESQFISGRNISSQGPSESFDFSTLWPKGSGGGHGSHH